MKVIRPLRSADPLDVALAAVLGAWLAFQISQFWVYWDTRLFVNLHVTLAAAMTATAFIQSKRGLPRWLVGVPALAIALYTALYFSPYGALAGAELTSSRIPSMVVGGLLLAVVVVMVWRAFGPHTCPVVAGIHPVHGSWGSSLQRRSPSLHTAWSASSAD